MKKWIALLIAALLILSMTACAEAAALPYEGVKLKAWLAPMQRDDLDQAFWESQFAKFTEATGAEVECEVVGWGDIATKYVTGFMSGDAADVMYTVNSVLYDLISQGFLLDLNAYWTEEEIADENYWDITEYDGKHYYVPFVGAGGFRCYCYNMDILKAAGVTELPTTWDELLDVCEKVHTANPDVYTFLLPMTGNNNAAHYSFNMFLYQAGGSLMNEANDAYTLNTEAGKEALSYLKTLVDKGYISTDCLGMEEANTNDLFVEGKAAISIISQPYTIMGDAFEWACSTEMANQKSAVYNAVDTIAVNANSANKEAAVALMKFMRSAEVMQAYADEGFYQNGPILKSYPNLLSDDPHMTEVNAHPERSMIMPIGPQLSTVYESIKTNVQLVVMGSSTVEEALENMQAAADNAFA